MKKTEHLYELIQSLTRTEKGYFKKFCNLYSSQKNQKYLIVFDYMDKLKEYDELLMRKKLSTQIEQKQFPSVKKYLHNLILKSLEAYHSQKSIETEIRSLLNQTEILYMKGLIEQAYKLLKKAKDMATEYELFYILGSIIDFEKEFITIESNTKEAQDHVFNLLNETELLNQKIIDLSSLKRLQYDVIKFQWKDGGTLNPEKDIEQAAVSNKETVEKLSSIKAKNFYHHTLLLYHYIIKKDQQKAFEHASANVVLIKQHQKLLYQTPRSVSRILYIYMILCFSLRKEEAFEEGMKLFNNIPKKNIRLAANMFDQQYSLFLNYALHLLKIKEGIQHTIEFRKGFKSYEKYIPERNLIVLYHLAAYLNHLDGNLDEALNWINEINLIPENAGRIDIRCVSKIQEILIHYDMANNLLLNSKLSTAKYYHEKNKRLFNPEQEILNSIKKSINSPKAEKSTILKSLKEKLEKHNVHQKPITCLNYIDVISWAESNINTKKKYADIVKEKRSQEV